MTPFAQAGYRRNLRREWVALSLVILSLVAWLCAAGGLRRVDHLVQDAGIRLYARPAWRAHAVLPHEILTRPPTAVLKG